MSDLILNIPTPKNHLKDLVERLESQDRLNQEMTLLLKEMSKTMKSMTERLEDQSIQIQLLQKEMASLR